MWSSLLVSGLVLPSVLLYMRHQDRGEGTPWLAVAMYALALFTKVEAIAALGVYALCEVLLTARQRPREHGVSFLKDLVTAINMATARRLWPCRRYRGQFLARQGEYSLARLDLEASLELAIVRFPVLRSLATTSAGLNDAPGALEYTEAIFALDSTATENSIVKSRLPSGSHLRGRLPPSATPTPPLAIRPPLRSDWPSRSAATPAAAPLQRGVHRWSDVH